jgi:hypothetical protein
VRWLDERAEGVVEAGDLCVEVHDAPGDLAHGVLGGGEHDDVAPGAEDGAGGDQLAAREPP